MQKANFEFCTNHLKNHYLPRDWTKENIEKVFQEYCPGNYTVEKDSDDRQFSFAIKFKTEKDKAWCYLHYV
jgi:hypothetical protein